MSITKLTAGLAAASLGLALSACGGDPTSDDSKKSASDTITVGSAAFPENEIIAEIYAQALEAQGVKVKKKLNIGAREVYIPALEKGEIDLIPEYTGNLLAYFDKDATATSPEQVDDALEDVLPDTLEVLDPAPAEDKDSLNVTPEYAAKNNLKTIGDLKNVGSFKLGANPEFKERKYGIPGLKSVYGITDVQFVPISDGGGPKTLKSLLDDDIQVADIYSTTPSILAEKLVTLEDPKNLIAAQNVIPLINDKKSSDKVEDILDKVSAALTTEDLLDLNSKNQGDDKTAPDVLAKQWLTDKGLI
ncbi:ABC transporter substrate-binding protein [Aeromicrobium wangtongii]|uniref:ABC transporter substrate-binding protein n=1 Tax=Aeromicrobium wangtongii TaxID=2969247 RepID=A0ABY5M7D0_9ACTN|nr:ABC transporter substrate-binding protein [Aeromicrobium wangtongii]MCD9199725.1 ABC transporter substrate-binding protein [Aeromicrobium wangtongii]UUP14074.1 ABC transporter substrate-binding protein [Aeromicrobium wangtongii]